MNQIITYNGVNYKINHSEDFHLWLDITRYAELVGNPQLTEELFSTLTTLGLIEKIEF